MTFRKVKTAAEKQKACRERQKVQEEEFLQAERVPVKEYHVLAAQMNKGQLTERDRRAMLRNIFPGHEGRN